MREQTIPDQPLRDGRCRSTGSGALAESGTELVACRNDIDLWLEDVRLHVASERPELNALIQIYIDEAKFGRNYIADELAQLPKGARILELGAGTLLLSCQLQREGFCVTAVEPGGLGFGQLGSLAAVVKARALAHNCLPNVLTVPGEALECREEYDLAFSVNVMEHVIDVAEVLRRVSRGLRRGASYRFICPNYAFPYEPHFGIPTLFSKKLTERVFGRRIRSASGLADQKGTWESLNWITAVQVTRLVRAIPDVEVSFQRDQFLKSMERVLDDPSFAARHSRLVGLLARALKSLGLLRMLIWVPTAIQPLMDCRIRRLGFGDHSSVRRC